jgi:hypothetical protein
MIFIALEGNVKCIDFGKVDLKKKPTGDRKEILYEF